VVGAVTRARRRLAPAHSALASSLEASVSARTASALASSLEASVSARTASALASSLGASVSARTASALASSPAVGVSGRTATLLGFWAGYSAARGGTFALYGAQLMGLARFVFARRGVPRTFQTAQVFGEMSLRDNFAVGIAVPRLGSVLGALVGTPAARRRELEIRAQAGALLHAHELGDLADTAAASLSAGLRRRLEIARALATQPILLMLDEPAAGLSPGRTALLNGRLTPLARKGGCPAFLAAL